MTNENDRELLEMAALAAGYDAMEGYGIMGPPFLAVNGEAWDPLADDGDALRLAVKLYINIQDAVYDHCEMNLCDYGNERYAAVRRAITTAAAEIGKQLKEKNHD